MRRFIGSSGCSRSIAVLGVVAVLLASTWWAEDSYAAKPTPTPTPIPQLTELGVQGANEYLWRPSACLVGTLGCLVQDGGGNYYILSSSAMGHTPNGALSLGDPVWHPACPYMSGRFVVGWVSHYARNLYDLGQSDVPAAVLIAVNPETVKSDGRIMEIGLLDPDPAEAYQELAVQKRGPHTGRTYGTISAIHAEADILCEQFDFFDPSVGEFPVPFTDQILVSSDQNFGYDTGALVVTQESPPRPVGLLIGRDIESGATVISPIRRVLDRLFYKDVCGSPPVGPLSIVNQQMPPDLPQPPALSVTVDTDKESYRNGETVLITVTVTDPDANAVADATVYLSMITANWRNPRVFWDPAVTDSDGTFQFSYTVNTKQDGRGTYWLQAKATDFSGCLIGVDSKTFQVTR